MFLDPYALAEAIAAAADEKLSNNVLRSLAWALGNGNGLAPGRTAVHVVLSDPLSTSTTFTIVKGPLSVSRQTRQLRTPERVVGAFRQACGGSDRIGEAPSSRFWLPEVTTPANTIEVGGDLPPCTTTKYLGRTINWYPLSQVRTGSVFYLYNFYSDALSVYQRVNATQYAHVRIEEPTQYVNVADVAANLASGKPVSGISRIPGTPTILWKN